MTVEIEGFDFTCLKLVCASVVQADLMISFGFHFLGELLKILSMFIDGAFSATRLSQFELLAAPDGQEDLPG